MTKFNRPVLFTALFLGVVIISSCTGETTATAPTVPTIETITPTEVPVTPAATPAVIPIPNGELKDTVIAAGDYMMRQQLSNGELSYQVNVMTGERNDAPSLARLLSGTGALYTVCRVSGDQKYCDAGDLALSHYLGGLVREPDRFAGTCLYTNGSCQLGSTAMIVDTIYRRWQATGTFTMNGRDLLAVSRGLGEFIVAMRKPEGGFYHELDPHYAGTVNPNAFVYNYPGQSLIALTELYEMTGNDAWLKQAREVNDFMLKQGVAEDEWHAYAFTMFARLDKLTDADKAYANQIADLVIAGEIRSLNPKNTSVSTATKIEALAWLAQAFYLSAEDHARLDTDINTFITFVQARQMPRNNCGWDFNQDMIKEFAGGILTACDDPSIRVDGLQYYINGATAYLEYQGMVAKQQ
jgi:hypothetical protein